MNFDDAELQRLSKTELIKAYTQVRASQEKVFAIASHDLRSPFSGLLGLSEMLAAGTGDIPPELLHEYLYTMHDSLKNTYQLLENLFEWGQIERNKYDKTVERIPLMIVVGEVLEDLQNAISQKEMDIIKSYDEDQIIETNSKMLEFVLKNLISNAVKFSKRKNKIEINCNAETPVVSLSVRDFGVGISEENIVKLFSLKSSWKIHGTEGESGTGLGLLASSRYAESFGAKLGVESTPGKGSTFTLTLPAPHA